MRKFPYSKPFQFYFKSVLNYLTLLSKSLKKELLLPLLNFLTVLSESYKKKDSMLSRLNHFTLLSKIENFFLLYRFDDTSNSIFQNLSIYGF